MVWLPAEACRGMTKCQVVLTLPVLVPKLDTLVVSLRREAANIWMAAGAQKPHSGKGLSCPRGEYLPFFHLLLPPYFSWVKSADPPIV